MSEREQQPDISERLKMLARLEEQILGLVMEYLSESTLYPMDLLANGAAKRSLALSSGFREMIEAKNMVCAGALLRLELDTAIRFYAAFIVAAPHAFAQQVFEGKKISDLKDRDGKRMHDAYLVGRLAQDENCEWLPRVYRETSGYVHLSGKHIFNTFTGVDDDSPTVRVRISTADEGLADEIYIEAVEAFIAVARLFSEYLHGWGFTKKNPRAVQELRKHREGEKPST